MSKIHWVHISDLHYNKDGVQTSLMRKYLPEYIASLNESNNIDYIFFTGDLRFAPKKDFSPEIVEYFDKICCAAHLDKESFFMVIGNHDVVRSNKSRLNAIQQITNEYFSDDDQSIDEKYYKSLKAGRSGFYRIIKDIVTDKQYELHTSNSNLHFTIETENLNIVHVDSTITYEEHKENDFYIDAYGIMCALEKCNQNKPIIVLSHYGIDSLEPNEQKTILRLLKDYNVQLWLCGHKHTDIIYKSFEFLYTIHSGNQNREKNTSPGFVEGFLDTETAKGYFRVHKWNKDAGWALYQTLIDDTDFKTNKRIKDRTKYRYKLSAYAAENEITIVSEADEMSDEIINEIKHYIKNYKGNSIQLEIIVNRFGISNDLAIKIMDKLHSESLVKSLDYNKELWQIMR